MSYWSVYISQEDEVSLKGLIEKIAKKNRWSFSQAVIGLLREHLINEKKGTSDEETWGTASAHAFFEGYSAKDAIYDTL